MGWDELKPLMIDNIKDSIKTLLTVICDKSSSNGLLPFEMKIANVVPIFNRGMRYCFETIGPYLFYQFFLTYLKD